MEYADLIDIFKGDLVLLDIHLCHLKVEEEDRESMLSILSQLSEDTRHVREEWKDYKAAFFDSLLNLPPSLKVSQVLKVRQMAYKVNAPRDMARYQKIVGSTENDLACYRSRTEWGSRIV